MLQITIYHLKDGSHYISKISDGDKVLAIHDESTGLTDVSVCEPYVGQDIDVLHIREEENGQFAFDFNAVNTLTNVGVDENGFGIIQYETRSKN